MAKKRGSAGKQDKEALIGRWPLDFDRPDFRDLPRTQFLKAIGRTAPDVMQSLHDELLPWFSEIIEDKKIDLRLMNDLTLRPFIFSQVTDLFLSIEPLVYSWANKLYLADRSWPVKYRQKRPSDPFGQPPLFDPRYFLDWLEPILVDTLGTWASGDIGPPLKWRLDGIFHEGIIQKEPIPVSFVAAGWSPLADTKATYVERVVQEFQDFLQQYVSDIEAAVTAPKLIKVPDQLARRFPEIVDIVEKINLEPKPKFVRPPKRFTPRHFDWLVLYQVLGQTNYSKIARKSEATPQTVMKGVRQAAEMVIGPAFSKWLRPVQRGRPKK